MTRPYGIERERGGAMDVRIYGLLATLWLLSGCAAAADARRRPGGSLGWFLNG